MNPDSIPKQDIPKQTTLYTNAEDMSIIPKQTTLYTNAEVE
jgi:hypothetical protein